MSKIIKIYCEGKAGSPDYDVLEKVIDGLPNIELQPIGSKFGGKNAIQVYEKLVSRSDFKLFFRDRDFDCPVNNAPELTIEGYVYFSHRITIENYLLSPACFWKFVQKKQIASDYNLENKDSVSEIFKEAAADIKYYQAARHSMGSMRVPTDFGTSWTSGSGKLPDDLSQESCRIAAIEKINIAQRKTENWNAVSFDNLFNGFITRFDHDFFENQKYLEEFQGKDLAASLKKRLLKFPMKPYYKFAIAEFDYTLFPDLVQLKGIIEHYIAED